MTNRNFKSRHRRTLRNTLIMIWVAAFTATHIPASHIPVGHLSDATLHLLGYAGLAALFWATLLAYGHRAFRRSYIAALVLILYAALDEATQPLVGRSGSIRDWCFDCLGVGASLATCEITGALQRLARRLSNARRLANTDKPLD